MHNSDLKVMTEVELAAQLRRALRGSAEASRSPERAVLEEVFERNYPWIYRICAYEIADETHSRDCAQEVMVQILRGIGAFDGRSEIKTWMFSIARRTIFRFRAAAKLREFRFPGFSQEDELREGRSDGGDPMIRSEQSAKLLELVRALPRQQRHAVLLHYFEDLTIAEAAARIGCSESTLKAHLFRARKRLGVLMGRSAEIYELMTEETTK